MVRLLLGTPDLPAVRQAAGPWVWLTVFTGVGLVVGRRWVVPLPLLLQPLTEQDMVFTGALRFYAFEWPLTALVLLVAVVAVGADVLVRYTLNRLAGGAAWPGFVVSFGFVVFSGNRELAMVWTAFLDPRLIAALGHHCSATRNRALEPWKRRIPSMA